MSDDEPQPQSIQQRIAALKLSQVGSGAPPSNGSPAPKPNPTTGKARPPPPPPPKPGVPARPNGYHRTESTNNPPLANQPNGGIGNVPEEPRPDGASANGMDGPRLPARTPSATAPALPQRRPSEMTLSRKQSSESVSSNATARSSVSGMSNGTSTTSRSERFAIRAPEFNPSALPALPPKRTPEEVQAHDQKYNAMRPTKSSSNPLANTFRKSSTPSVPTRPQVQARPAPALPARTGVKQEQPTAVPQETHQPEAPARRLQPPPPRKSALGMGFGNAIQPKPSPSNRPSSTPAIEATPPPIPTGSRPDLAALQASKPKLGAASNPQYDNGPASCLHCRDFSGPDNHAARFPRESIPSTDVGWLSHQLTSPFPSATDKARAIFTWLHHNVEYDVVAFFNNNVKPSTPQSTISSGLAVCEGYAGLFAALAIKAGLECIVISGACKGFGHRQLQPGEPLPAFATTHAWNACRIDGGEWKLIDPCWGAGNVQGRGQPYQKHFKPVHFTESNSDFGRSHYPTDTSKQFRNDGRILSWEEYQRSAKSGTAAHMFSGFVAEEGLAEGSFAPLANPVVLAQQGPTTRFMFQKVCPHWDPVRCGRGEYYLYVLHLEELDGTDRNHVPFEKGDGVWWCDVRTEDLGRPGQKASIYTVTQFGGREGRGLSLQEYRDRKGRVGMGFGGVATWDIA
ncbi:hypothetical protein WHR41_06800 [Cladosporium halotolerans]|uniref:Transglutaminase-like domain-containing protein n=1 Tax=Cladosporium halotolerans TaxID=1052096 RepID=A0AB34KJQ6_9PEZI